MDDRVERVVFETERQRIVGDLTLPKEGFRSRLSEFLNHGGVDFIALTEVRISELDGGAAAELPFIAVARSHIHLAYPQDGSTE